MHLGSPLALAGLILVIPLIALFILRIKPRRVEVATARMWNALLPQSRPRQWWSKLRDPLFLLLQLVLLGLLTAALTEPQYVDPSHPPVTRVLLLDNSASMHAMRNGTLGWNAALAAARRVVEHLRPGDQLAIVTTAQPPSVLQGVTSDKQQLKQSLDTARISATPSALSQALRFARELTATAGHSEIWAVTDNQGAAGLAADDMAQIKWLNLGRAEGNAAIVQFQVRRVPTDPIAFETLIRVEQFDTAAKSAELRLTLAGTLLDAIPLTLDPNSPWQKVTQYTSESGGELVAELQVDDVLPLDNRAVALVPPREQRKVTLVTPGSHYLEYVLQAIPAIELTVTNRMPDPVADETLLVLHRQPLVNLPPGRSMWIEVMDGSTEISAGEYLEQPWILQQTDGSPLLAHLDLREMPVPGARQLMLPAATQVLAQSEDGTPVFAMLHTRASEALLLNLSLDQGELAWRTAFPLLMSHAVNWLAGQSDEDRSASIATGETIRWTIPRALLSGTAGSCQFTLIAPNGGEQILTAVQNQVTLGPFDQVGVWALRHDAESEDLSPVPEFGRETHVSGDRIVARFACNLVNRSESNLMDPGPTTSREQDGFALSHPLWFYGVLAGLVLLPVEWWLYQRRWIG